jgi:hypothetical protein
MDVRKTDRGTVAHRNVVRDRSHIIPTFDAATFQHGAKAARLNSGRLRLFHSTCTAPLALERQTD